MWVLPGIAAVVLAGGCFGSSAAHAPATEKSELVSPAVLSPAYASLHVRHTDAANGTSGEEVPHERFSLICAVPGVYRHLQGILAWKAKLCRAILDFQTRNSGVVLCGCRTPTSVTVSVAGTIRGRPIHERFTHCLCADGNRAAADVVVILRTHPPVQ